MCEECYTDEGELIEGFEEGYDDPETLTVEEAVANGVEFLDMQVPGWRSRIEMEALNLRNTELCILGQLFAHEAYEAARYDGFAYAIEEFGGRNPDVWAAEHGFDTWTTDYNSSDLQEAWEAELSK